MSPLQRQGYFYTLLYLLACRYKDEHLVAVEKPRGVCMRNRIMYM
jgi:hypothetical protein